MKSNTQRFAAIAALALIATPAAAQSTTDPAAYPATEEREDEFPWGLLGLLGLAGLMGMKRKDDDHHNRNTGSGTMNR